MSSRKSQENGKKRVKDSSEVVYSGNILHSIETRTQPLEQQSDNSDDQCKRQGKPAIYLTPSPSTYHQFFESIREEYEHFLLENEKIKNIDKFLSRRTLHSDIEDVKPSHSNLLASKKKKRVFLQSVPATKKAVKGSSVNKPPLFKDFSPHLFKLPFTKQVLAESLSHKEACGFFKHLMTLKRLDFRCMEQQMDDVLTELQKAIRDAKSICMRLESISQILPLNINAPVVEVEKLMYLLGSSFRIFKKLEQCGSILNDSLQKYSKDTLDYHQNLLELCLD
ncbi:hypothetical protein HNY73_007288 [Argiope bruennichi]|uniref:Uncharacterized protein n=1 Tax=Argiope bruennichi TaxID=94029 RepID=A0A8T0FDH4_ARGBR|nr:hypothetical protein HNY73_007288 [Argiope bruennichi]